MRYVEHRHFDTVANTIPHISSLPQNSAGGQGKGTRSLYVGRKTRPNINRLGNMTTTRSTTYQVLNSPPKTERDKNRKNETQITCKKKTITRYDMLPFYNAHDIPKQATAENIGVSPRRARARVTQKHGGHFASGISTGFQEAPQSTNGPSDAPVEAGMTQSSVLRHARSKLGGLTRSR